MRGLLGRTAPKVESIVQAAGSGGRGSAQEDVHAIVTRSDFDVAIAGSVPLIHDFHDVDPTPAPIKTSGCRSENRMRLDLNAHDWIIGLPARGSPILGLVLRYMPPPNHCDCDDADECGDVDQ
jgi:hypothetical protein